LLFEIILALGFGNVNQNLRKYMWYFGNTAGAVLIAGEWVSA